MQLVYNIVQLTALILFAPLLFVKAILTPRYRLRVLKRLGMGLAASLAGLEPRPAGPRFWVHGLSVGEVSSAVPLVKGLRARYPDCQLIVSASTRTGQAIAEKSLAGLADLVFAFPFDLLWVVRRCQRLISPDLFIMVETDFWPNFLFELNKQRIPAILVNGRISQRSFALYRRFGFLFGPLFGVFKRLAMQTEADRESMLALGPAAGQVVTLGNLKYDTALPGPGQQPTMSRAEYGIPADALLLIAGSTHPGEEESVLAAFGRLRVRFPELFLVVAPRKVERGGEVTELARQHGLSSFRRTGEVMDGAPLLVLDTLGELSSLYVLADLVFVGGSLVPEGGHNPLEPACHGKPVLFGPHMEDFAEISRDLLARQGACQVADGDGLYDSLCGLLDDPIRRQAMGDAALALVQENRGVTDRHVQLVEELLGERG